MPGNHKDCSFTTASKSKRFQRKTTDKYGERVSLNEHYWPAAGRALDWAVEKANEKAKEDQRLRRLTVHSLRHSGASIRLMNGTPIPEVSAILGHANVNITLAVYTHFIPKMQTDSASKLAAAIFNRQNGVGDEVGLLKTT